MDELELREAIGRLDAAVREEGLAAAVALSGALRRGETLVRWIEGRPNTFPAQWPDNDDRIWGLLEWCGRRSDEFGFQYTRLEPDWYPSDAAVRAMPIATLLGLACRLMVGERWSEGLLAIAVDDGVLEAMAGRIEELLTDSGSD